MQKIEQKYNKLKQKLTEQDEITVHECCYNDCDEDILHSEYSYIYDHYICYRCYGLFCLHHEHLKEDYSEDEICMNCLVGNNLLPIASGIIYFNDKKIREFP